MVTINIWVRTVNTYDDCTLKYRPVAEPAVVSHKMSVVITSALNLFELITLLFYCNFFAAFFFCVMFAFVILEIGKLFF